MWNIKEKKKNYHREKESRSIIVNQANTWLTVPLGNTIIKQSTNSPLFQKWTDDLSGCCSRHPTKSWTISQQWFRPRRILGANRFSCTAGSSRTQSSRKSCQSARLRTRTKLFSIFPPVGSTVLAVRWWLDMLYLRPDPSGFEGWWGLSRHRRTRLRVWGEWKRQWGGRRCQVCAYHRTSRL